MPKVSKEYVEQKKQLILNSALNVCKEKPLYEITMSDVIKESGLSQGGIYLYFSDLDEILIAVINMVNANINYKEEIDEIIKKSKSYTDIIRNLFSFLGRYIKENVKTIGKFQFELTVLLANHPERQEKFLASLAEVENNQYLLNKLFENINKGIVAKELKPELPIQNIFKFIMTSLDGIVRDTVLQKCYGSIINSPDIDEINLLDTLAKSVLLMLNAK